MGAQESAEGGDTCREEKRAREAAYHAHADCLRRVNVAVLYSHEAERANSLRRARGVFVRMNPATKT